MTTARAYVALGANLGDARTTVSRAMNDLDALPQTRVVRRSSLIEQRRSTLRGRFRQWRGRTRDFARTRGAARGTAASRRGAGRKRPYRNAPRTLDLDLLSHEHGVMQTAVLTLPHPRMFERAFVLVPLAEIAPEQVTAAQLAAVAEQPIDRL
ncbi:MAG: 2-amino-4-hydroxy-6-hydroxymethyldihydropteridine diphosphokinase [Variovorax sp.]